ncbi:CocE/NonD family hydrolase [Halobium palmae]|uniref:CocE/NonD family hydrolase n=1 Tax=Halobium palmae TaxID=1776492 RepID=A0ABD5RW96_9EURY
MTPNSTPPNATTPQETPSDLDHEVRRDIMVEMRDGVRLATDVHLPEGEGPFPTLVNRTPYNKATDTPVGTIGAAIERGYAVVQQDVRGRFNSGGWFEPFFEGEDGYDTVEWAAEQDWSTGDVGMYGVSYRGMAVIRALEQDPPSLVAAAPLVTPANFYRDLQYMGGADNFGTSLAWSLFNSGSQIDRIADNEAKAKELRGEIQRLIENWPDSARFLPTIDFPALDEGVAQYWQDWHNHPTYDVFWQELDILDSISSVSTPVIHLGGWYDIFLQGYTALYSAIEECGQEAVSENQHMVIGPWTHSIGNPVVGERDFGEQAQYNAGEQLVFPWFDHWLHGSKDALDSVPKVQYFQMGEDEWRSDDEWPPAEVESTTYYLTSGGNANSMDGDGVITTTPLAEDVPVDEFTYDPLDPVPTRGGPILMGPLQESGVVDQRPVEKREDVLVYTSAELERPLEIAGNVEATFFVESSAPDTDFVARLVDVGPDGYAANITEGALRLRYRNSFETPEFMNPGCVYEVSIELRPVAHTFKSGHRLRVDVTSSNFPKLDRNPNAAIPVARATEDEMQTAEQTIYHDSDRPSRITLPVRQ